ncbi:MAG: diaminopimelate epimerase [Chloroflexi bacterium]|nr:diaminopimelate epimerase [Chloroflexota bacterium]
MYFAKMHGAGNDYVVLDARALDLDWAQLARAMSDRHFGAGSDGLILVVPSRSADIRMRMFNPDGSEAEMCGNGIRCFAKFAIERGIASATQGPLRVETLAGVRTVAPIFQGDKVVRTRVGMGHPILKAVDVPLDPAYKPSGARGSQRARKASQGGRAAVMSLGEEIALDWPLVVQGQEFKVTGVSMGNPHAVAFVREPVERLDLHTIGPEAEHHPMFPKRVNFEVVNVLGAEHLRARVWERGAGETLACGTGACAIAVAARLHGLTSDQVDITLPGGVLSVHWDGQGEVVLEGPVEEVFRGEWTKGV